MYRVDVPATAVERIHSDVYYEMRWSLMTEVTQMLLNGQSNMSAGAIQLSIKFGKTGDLSLGKFPLRYM